MVDSFVEFCCVGFDSFPDVAFVANIFIAPKETGQGIKAPRTWF
jgi:hypothetical protein